MWLTLLISLVGLIIIGIIMYCTFNKKFGFKQKVITNEHPPKTTLIRQHCNGNSDLDGTMRDNLDIIPSNPIRNAVSCLHTNGVDNYFDTKYTPLKTDVIEIYGKFNDLTQSFSGTTSSNNDRFYFGIDQGKWQIGYGSVYNRSNDADTNWHHFKLDNGLMYVDGTVVANALIGMWVGQPEFTYKLGAQQNSTGIQSFGDMTISSFKVNGVDIFAFEEVAEAIAYNLNSGTNGTYEFTTGTIADMHTTVDGIYSRNADKGFTKSGTVYIPAKTDSDIYDVQGNRLTNPPNCVHNGWEGANQQKASGAIIDAVKCIVNGVEHTLHVGELEVYGYPTYVEYDAGGEPIVSLVIDRPEDDSNWWWLLYDIGTSSEYKFDVDTTSDPINNFPMRGVYTKSGSSEVSSVDYDSIWINEDNELTNLYYNDYLGIVTGLNSNALKWITNPETGECFVKEQATYNQNS
ncbi:MAG: hypothetical protein KAH03_08555, partial [Cocleimonas sp.]|nr:hypothetical protein [Cocleimonas sp.]